MIEVNIRKQGSSAVMTIPADVLKILGVDVGDTLVLDVRRGSFNARPVERAPSRRYKLSELLQGVTQEKMDALIHETSWAQDGDPTGAEMA